MKEKNKYGACLCGLVKFMVTAPLNPPDACHCIQCRKHSGHYFASTDVPRAAVKVTGEEHITWYQSSSRVRRGFCSRCGSSLFFDPPAKDWIGVAMGAFEGPTQTQLEMHIFVAEKGDYYEIRDGVRQNQH
jgi:hypothetical protein